MHMQILKYRIEINVYKDVDSDKQNHPVNRNSSSIHSEAHYSEGERKYQNEHKSQKTIPTVLILFLKADDAKTLIDSVKQKGKLYEGAETALFVNTMKMWVGNDSQYAISTLKNEFSRDECSDSFVKEYDYVAMRFELSREYKGYNKNDDSYERNEFFSHICKDGIKLIECSSRLSFDASSTTEAYDVY